MPATLVTIPKTIYVLAIAFLYGLIAYFWKEVPFDQTVFSLVVIAILGKLGFDVGAEVRALRSDLKARGILP